MKLSHKQHLQQNMMQNKSSYAYMDLAYYVPWGNLKKKKIEFSELISLKFEKSHLKLGKNHNMYLEKYVVRFLVFKKLELTYSWVLNFTILSL